MADERSYGKAQPSSGKMTPTSSVDSNATDENEDPELMVTTFDNTELEKLRKWANVDSWDSGATLVVRVVGVNMDCGMGWLYEQATQGGRKIERILDTYSPSGVSHAPYFPFFLIQPRERLNEEHDLCLQLMVSYSPGLSCSGFSHWNMPWASPSSSRATRTGCDAPLNTREL